MKRKWLVAAILTALLVVGAALFFRKRPRPGLVLPTRPPGGWPCMTRHPRRGVTLEELKAMAWKTRGEIRFAGTVTDDSGDPLDGVMMRAVFGFQGDEPSGPRVDSLTVNREFAVGRPSASTVEFWFYKEGYYETKLSFSVRQDGELVGEKKKAIRQDNLRVVLEKTGAVTPLRDFGRAMKFMPDGRMKVILFSTAKPRFTGPVALEPLDTLPARPEHGMYFRAPVKDGKIASGKKTFVLTSPQGGKVAVEWTAGRWELVMFGKDDGFIVYEPPERASSPQDLTRQMKTAPASGYQNSLSLETSPFNNDSRGSCLFYFRIAGLYGKGYTRLTRTIADDGSRLGSHVKLLLQTDGTRNVRDYQ